MKMPEIVSVEKVRQATQAFRLMNLLVGVAALCWIVLAVTVGSRQADTIDRIEQISRGTGRVEPPSFASDVMSTMSVGGVIVTPLLLALGAYRLARSIDSASPLLWAVLSALGCLGVLVVVLLSNQAIKWFSRQGLKVGLTPSPSPSKAARTSPPSGRARPKSRWRPAAL
jgi:uncharacterized membrane protein